jgi:hypothetical protein
MKQLVLLCINDHPTNDVIQAAAAGLPFGSTMDRMPQWSSLAGIQPARPNPAGQSLPLIPPVLLNSYFPVRVYRCRVCGYVEMYSGVIVEPNVWGTNG